MTCEAPNREYGLAVISSPSVHFRRMTGVAIMCGFILLLLVKNPSVAVGSVRSGMELCAKRLIPSLFPFMIVSELIIRSDLSQAIGKLISPISRKLFGMSGEAGCAFILGSLLGFPIGAVMGNKLYERGRLCHTELCRLLCFSSNPGAAFTIITLGAEHLGSLSCGVLLYLSTCGTAILIGVISKYFFRGSKKHSSVPYWKDIPRPTEPLPRLFTDAVKGSTLSMLYVCGFVVFFSTIVGSLDAVFEAAYNNDPFPTGLRALMYGSLELTSGLFFLSPSLPHNVSLPLCAAILGFSGLSVHFQIMSVCSATANRPAPPYLPFFLVKALHSLLNFLTIFTIMKIFM